MEILAVPIDIAVAITTFCLAVATWRMARATEKTLDAQYRPFIIVYVELDKEHPECINLVVENVGTAPASNIHFEMPEYFPWGAGGLKSGKAEKAKNLTLGPLRNGMKYLAPRAAWRSYWGQFGGLHDSLDGRAVEIVAHFSYLNGHPAEPSKNILDVRDFESICWVSSNSQKQTDALEKQAKSLEAIKVDLRKIVNSLDS